ncbi:hypothetical protein [Alishewanella longhuensis]
MERFAHMILLTDETTQLSTTRDAEAVGIDVEQCSLASFGQLRQY